MVITSLYFPATTKLNKGTLQGPVIWVIKAKKFISACDTHSLMSTLHGSETSTKIALAETNER